MLAMCYDIQGFIDFPLKGQVKDSRGLRSTGYCDFHYSRFCSNYNEFFTQREFG